MRYREPDPSLPEVPLLGGDVTEGLVRVGDTVRRPTGPQTPLVIDVLTHLERVGFDGAPRHLGIDEAGRQVVSYVPGEVASRPRPGWIADETRIVSVARLLRRYDDAVETLGVPAAATGLPPADPAGTPARVAGTPELIGHLDVTPDNVVFAHGEARALIDFDFVRPATRTEEVQNLLLWWAPLVPVQDRPRPLADVDVFARARLLVDAYGLAAADRARLVDVVENAAARAWFRMRHNAETLGGGWARMWDEGVGEAIRRRQVWLAEHRDALHRAVAG
ncbi:aminoglycoside phosphotransferase [Mumia sp. zg.B53]|uniref:aminoglycoside phosphotransferase n=1 Tax=Mumia sp. zg.B53 TaxID=2855449 RepID=UPI001C6F3AD7|nr:aminoglycoside phosphotransferase [Mumia sp. zg.B53]MBW9215749.1 aminoglycoside phosphotransferase [Mumia sp. zg.B53]